MTKGQTVVIKKYGNRRLYDTERSEYINLEEVASILKKDRDIRVVDAKTGEDLTRTVLLQLILERERNNISGFPEDLLKELIMIQDTPARRWFDLSMRYSLELLRRMKRQSRFLRKPMEAAGMNPAGIFELLMGMGMPGAPATPEPPPQTADDDWEEPEHGHGHDGHDGHDPEDDQPDMGEELAALQAKLAQLEKKLTQGKKKKAAPKRKKAR